MTGTVYNPRVGFDASPILYNFVTDRSYFSGVMGPLGSGKTVACCTKLMSLAMEQKPDKAGWRRTRWAIIRNTYPELISTTIKTWLWLFPEASCGPMRYSHPITHAIRIAPVMSGDKVVVPGLDCEVLFMALDKPDDVKHLKSLDLTGAYVNEGSELPFGVIDMLTGRVGRFPDAAAGWATWRGIISDTNATDDQNWWYAYSEGGEKPLDRVKLHDGTWVDVSWTFFKQPPALLEVEETEHGYAVCEPGFDRDAVDPEMVLSGGGRTWYVNPKSENFKYLLPGYYHQQVQKKRFEWIQRYLQAKYIYFIDGKAWIPEYSDAVMAMGIPWDQEMPLVGGIDCGGGTLNPAAVIGQKGRMGDWRVLFELSMFDIGIDRFADLLAQKMAERFPGNKGVKFYIDPAGKGRDEIYETSVEQHFTDKGFDVELASTNDVNIRREALAIPMGRMIVVGGRPKPGFLVHKDCKMLRAGLAGKWFLKRVQGRDDRYHEKPVKNEWSHVCDAAQYMVLGGGEGRLLVKDKSHPSNKWATAGSVQIDQGWDVFTG